MPLLGVPIVRDCVFCNLLGSRRVTFIAINHGAVAFTPLDEYRKGHTIVALKKHRRDITDTFTGAELLDFMSLVNQVAQRLKDTLDAERIYVCSMCDGVEHFHAHLIPRYKGDKTGFRFLAEQEKKYDAIRYPQESSK